MELYYGIINNTYRLEIQLPTKKKETKVAIITAYNQLEDKKESNSTEKFYVSTFIPLNRRAKWKDSDQTYSLKKKDEKKLIKTLDNFIENLERNNTPALIKPLEEPLG